MHKNIRENYNYWHTSTRSNYYNHTQFLRDIKTFLNPLIREKKVLLAPASKITLRYVDILKEHKKFLGIYDGKPSSTQWNGIDVYGPDAITRKEPEILIITSMSYADEIEGDVKKIIPGISIIKIKDLLNQWTGNDEPTLRQCNNSIVWEINGHKLETHKKTITTVKKILFIRHAPCIRIYKMAVSLSEKGIEVYDGYSGETYENEYHMEREDIKAAFAGTIKIKNFKDLVALSSEFDIVHCHNRPDILTLMALAGRAPVIHDAHELVFDPPKVSLESYEAEELSNRYAHGKIYVSDVHREIIKKRYTIDMENALIFPNYTLGKYIPSRFKDKISTAENEIHIVYQGTAGKSNKMPTHRQFNHVFQQLMDNAIHLHVYTQFYDDGYAAWAQENKYFHYHKAINPKTVIEEISQYDFGILPFPYNEQTKDYLDVQSPHKLYEYLAAGLPVISSKGKAKEKIIRENQVGIIYETIDEVIPKLPGLKKSFLQKSIDVKPYCFESNINRLIEFYGEIIKKFNANEAL